MQTDDIRSNAAGASNQESDKRDAVSTQDDGAAYDTDCTSGSQHTVPDDEDDASAGEGSESDNAVGSPANDSNDAQSSDADDNEEEAAAEEEDEVDMASQPGAESTDAAADAGADTHPKPGKTLLIAKQ